MASGEGWHNDPYGRFAQRYHNGTDWTEHVSDGSGSAMVDPSGTSPQVAGGVPGPPPGYGEQATATQGGPFTGLAGNPILRFVARLIDGLLIGLPLYLISDALFGLDMNFDEAGGGADFPVGAYVFMTIVFAAYEIWMIGTYGRTVGKMAMGLTVVRRSTGDIPGYGVAVVRYLAWILYAIPLIGLLLFIVTVVMGFADSLRQTIHDKIAGTVVAKTSTLRS